MDYQIWVAMRKSQIKTLADLHGHSHSDWPGYSNWRAVRIGRVSLAELGRLLTAERDMAAKHAIKRAWRFTSNPGVHIAEAMQNRSTSLRKWPQGTKSLRFRGRQ